MVERENNTALAQQICRAASERWPTLVCRPETVAQHLTTAAAEVVSSPDELALALLCARGDQAALAILEREFVREIPAYLSRIDSSPDFADEVAQILRVRLLVGAHGNPPTILSYSGAGPLGGWLRVTAVRQALSLKRSRTPSGHDVDDLAELALPMTDVMTRAATVAPFQAALRKALAGVSARERNVLRLRFVDNWSPEDIGKSYGVHRGTVARWIAAARSAVRSAMAQDLMTTMGFTESEFESVARLIESRLHISLSQLNALD